MSEVSRLRYPDRKYFAITDNALSDLFTANDCMISWATRAINWLVLSGSKHILSNKANKESIPAERLVI